jgi:hypothetical protein
MKNKKKLIAVLLVFLLFAIPINIAQASKSNEEQKNASVIVELATVNEGKIFSTKIFPIEKEELAEFEKSISILMDNVQSATSWEEIVNIIENLPSNNGIIASIIQKILLKIKQSRIRGFVLSFGHSFKLNPFRKNSFKIREESAFWRCSNGGKIKDRTIIIKPLAFKIKKLEGLQFGHMSNFFGIYIYIVRKFPEKSTTFFMGTARRINGIQLFPF